MAFVDISDAEKRRQALEARNSRMSGFDTLGEALPGIVQSIGGVMEASEKKDQLKRSQRMEAVKTAAQLTQATGREVTPEAVEAYMAPQKGSGLFGMFGDDDQQTQPPTASLYGEKTPDALLKESDAALIRKINQEKYNQLLQKPQLEMEKRNEKLNADPFDKLPEDKKQTITKLSQANAGKTAIVNSIDSVLGVWDTLNDDQKLQQGRQLIKTLNSTQGQDAVGVDEAKRLAGKLEFAMGNIFSDNSLQVGRDLQGFKDDATTTSNAIKNSILLNQREIDSAYNRNVAPFTALDPAKGARLEELRKKKSGKSMVGVK